MYDNFIETDEILEIYGNPNDFKLDHILDPPDTEEDDINLVHQSPYYSIGDLPMYLQTIGNINVLSLNTQSVNAKFDSIITFLEVAWQQNVHFQVICLQESWLNDISDLSLFQNHLYGKGSLYKFKIWVTPRTSSLETSTARRMITITKKI